MNNELVELINCVKSNDGHFKALALIELASYLQNNQVSLTIASNTRLFVELCFWMEAARENSVVAYYQSKGSELNHLVLLLSSYRSNIYLQKLIDGVNSYQNGEDLVKLDEWIMKHEDDLNAYLESLCD